MLGPEPELAPELELELAPAREHVRELAPGPGPVHERAADDVADVADVAAVAAAVAVAAVAAVAAAVAAVAFVLASPAASAVFG